MGQQLDGIRNKDEKNGYNTDGPQLHKGGSGGGGRGDRGYHSAADGGGRRGNAGSESDEDEAEYGDAAWVFDEAKDVFALGRFAVRRW